MSAKLIPAWWGRSEPGSPYSPSNGTEGECFHAEFCQNCARDVPMNSGKDPDLCEPEEVCQILSNSFIGQQPEWVHDHRGWPTCTAFLPVGTAIPRPRDDRTIDMFGDQP